MKVYIYFFKRDMEITPPNFIKLDIRNVIFTKEKRKLQVKQIVRRFVRSELIKKKKANKSIGLEKK